MTTQIALHDRPPMRTTAWGRFWLFLAVMALLGRLSSLHAHDPGLSTAQVVIFPDRIEILAGFAPSDARFLIDPQAASADPFGDLDFDAARHRLAAAAKTLWRVQTDQGRLEPSLSSADLVAGDNLSLSIRYPKPHALKSATFTSVRIGDFPSGHRQFVVVSDPQGALLAKKLISQKSPELAIVVSPSGTTAESVGSLATDATPTWRGFILLGIEHIWTGYDHLLFLFALLLVSASLRSIVTIISCFTLAHSLTLAAATFSLIDLSPRWVEPLIAASIVYVGLENLVRGASEPSWRWLLTFGFGLIHGLGFATVLKDLGVGASNGAAIPLICFNLGVELGQIALALVVLPLLWRARRYSWFARRGVLIASCVITLFGAFWFAERVGWI